MENHNIAYFRNLWKMNMSELENQCNVWEKICNDSSIPDDVKGEIRTVVGLTRLLMNQKLKQFKGLIDDSEFHTGEKEITCLDLEGFWDMVYFEVEKIQKRFQKLVKCKSNEWKFVEENSETSIKKKVPFKKDVIAINKKKDLLDSQRLAARQRIAEVKRKMIAERKENRDQNCVEILQSKKEEQSEASNLNGIGRVGNAVALTDKSLFKECNENEKQNIFVHKKAVTPLERCDASEEFMNLNDSSKQKSVPRKKFSSSLHNKENVFLDSSSDMKLKQTKLKESGAQEPGKAKTKGFGKLQCVTRSAAKKAMLQQQNILQK